MRDGDEWGIVTDHDFRKRVATGELAPGAPVRDLASFPALTVGEEFSQAAAFSRMIDRGVHHLVVLDSRGAPAGILRAVDFASAEIRNPLLIRSQIESADSVASLRAAAELLKPTLVELSAAGAPARQVGNLLAAIVDALLRKLVTFHGLDALASPPSWIVLGSMARREPLPHSDVDTAMVWSEPSRRRRAADLFERAEALLVDMESCGLARCVDGANAVNPLFGRSSEAWANAVSRWLQGADGAAGAAAVVDRDRQPAAHRGRAGPDRDRRDAAATAQPGLPARLHQGGHRRQTAQRLRARVRRRPPGSPPRRARTSSVAACCRWPRWAAGSRS